ncbi:MAG: hypothetical protein CMLOHMNK_02204 [Steroidobacteraceae bacterium]|nr:hypothetical protein [Steroidobacteraceae bacterium]
MRFEKQEFDAQTIVLDDNEYIDCTFRNCKFQYHGGEFNIERIRFDTLEFTVGGAAARTVLLLQSLWSGEVGRQAVLGLLDPSAAVTNRQQ